MAKKEIRTQFERDKRNDNIHLLSVPSNGVQYIDKVMKSLWAENK